MGLLSKLFGKTEEDSVESMYGDEKHFFDNLRDDDKPQPVNQKPLKPVNGQPPRGKLSWGPFMPEEENQYSYSGSYIDYFNMVFTEGFPGYEITHAPAENRYHPAEIFTFSSGGRPKLVVELMSEKSSVRTLANQCRHNGIPYLRFYYDHQGWWNARSYVTDRVRGKLSV